MTMIGRNEDDFEHGPRPAPQVFIECPMCGFYHPEGFKGDCRADETRFSIPGIDELRDRQAATGSRRAITVEFI